MSVRPDVPPMRAAQRGAVTDFDREAGLGEVRAADGAVYPFHCIVIADGSRTIEVGTPVEFEVLAKLGRWEADHVRPAPLPG